MQYKEFIVSSQTLELSLTINSLQLIDYMSIYQLRIGDCKFYILLIKMTLWGLLF